MLLGSITAVFFICWGPLIFYTILFEFKPEVLPERTVIASVGYTLSLLFGMLTPIANPVSIAPMSYYTKKLDRYDMQIRIYLLSKRSNFLEQSPYVNNIPGLLRSSQRSLSRSDTGKVSQPFLHPLQLRHHQLDDTVVGPQLAGDAEVGPVQDDDRREKVLPF